MTRSLTIRELTKDEITSIRPEGIEAAGMQGKEGTQRVSL